MGLENLRETRRRWNCFSKVDTLGAFDFYTFVVSLDSIQPADLLNGLKAAEIAKNRTTPLTIGQYEAIDRVLSLAVHEYTHFTDASSTLWGMRYMQLLAAGFNSAVGSVKRPRSESNFFRAKMLFDFVRSIRWPDYYTEQYTEGDTENRPWSAANSGGRIFDARGKITDRPIIFTRFADQMGNAIVRSPLSTVSVLEASATAQELMFRVESVQSLEDDARIVEERQISQKTMDYIYRREITEYSVCAHLFANRQGCADILVAYRCVAVIARLALNMPAGAIPILEKNMGAALQKIFGWKKNSDWTKLVREGVRRHDIGSIYYLLVSCMPKDSHLTSASFKTGLQIALKHLGLDLDALAVMAEVEVIDLANKLANSEIAPIVEIAAAGALNYRSISWEQPMLKMGSLHLPKVVLGDLSLEHIFSNSSNVLAQFNVEQSYEELVHSQIWIENFAEACF